MKHDFQYLRSIANEYNHYSVTNSAGSIDQGLSFFQLGTNWRRWSGYRRNIESLLARPDKLSGQLREKAREAIGWPAVRSYLQVMTANIIAPDVEVPLFQNLDKLTAIMLQDWWSVTWGSAPISYSGQTGLDLEIEILKTMLIDGDVFVQKLDQLDKPLAVATSGMTYDGDVDPKNKDEINCNGVLINANTNEINGYVFLSKENKSDRIPPEQIIHVLRRDKAYQYRGVSWISYALVNLNLLDEFTTNSANAAATMSKIPATIQESTESLYSTGVGVGSGGVQGGGFQSAYNDTSINSDGVSNNPSIIPDNFMMQLPAGRMLSPVMPQISPELERFSTQLKRMIATSLSVSYSSLWGDHSHHNHASLRQEDRDKRQFMSVNQRFWHRTFRRPVFRHLLFLARKYGQIKLTDAEYKLAMNPVWVGVNINSISPKEDVAAATSALAGGLITHAQASIMAGGNGNINAIATQLGMERKAFIDAGVTIDLTQAGQVLANQAMSDDKD